MTSRRTTDAQSMVVNWARRQIELETFRSRSDVLSFARRVAMLLVPAATAINILAHLVIDRFGLLPYPLPQALAVGSIMAIGITAIVSLTFSIIIGSAMLKLSAERSEFERLSQTDMLSGLLNRRAFTERCRAGSEASSLVIFDIDLFKKINDAHGHAAGDAVIVAVAARLKASFSGNDSVARIGGEEFGVIVHHGNIETRRERVDAARQAVAASPIETGAAGIAVTVSAGMADFSPGRHIDDVYRQADRALYLAKAQGRNRVFHETQLAPLNTDRPADVEAATRTRPTG